MKAPIALLILGLYSTVSFGASNIVIRKPVVMKEALKVDFHNMIVSTGEEKKQLQQEIVAKDTAEEQQYEAAKNEAYLKQKEEQKVIDFVDVEIGVGEAPAMVDRRAN